MTWIPGQAAAWQLMASPGTWALPAGHATALDQCSHADTSVFRRSTDHPSQIESAWFDTCVAGLEISVWFDSDSLRVAVVMACQCHDVGGELVVMMP
jgi:hypothetical protein